jgi:hypothetical protein
MRNLTFVRALISCAAFAAAVAGTNAQAVERTQVVDISGIDSYDVVGNENNTVIELDLGAHATVTSFSFNVTLTAYAPSYLSEMDIYYTNSTLNRGVIFTAALDIEESGTRTLSDSYDLVADGFSFSVGADGILRIEFAESYNDSLTADGRWQSGTITFGYDDHQEVSAVPEPETYAMMMAGLLFVGAIARRRRNS